MLSIGVARMLIKRERRTNYGGKRSRYYRGSGHGALDQNEYPALSARRNNRDENLIDIVALSLERLFVAVSPIWFSEFAAELSLDEGVEGSERRALNDFERGALSRNTYVL